MAFFDGNPGGGGKLSGPLFYTSVHVAAQKESYVHTVSGKDAGILFAAVNSDGATLPMNNGPDTTFKEKDYTNNITQLSYWPEAVQLHTDVAAGLLATSTQAVAARRWLAYLHSPEAQPLFASAGLTPLNQTQGVTQP